jgi:5-methylcytosine-specific restriction protein A
MRLSRQQTNELEDQALLAFKGRLEPLVHGFRVMRENGQAAAVYWSDNYAGNDVEIAICDSRLTDSYNLKTIRRWIERERVASGRDCNIHKHGSDWPIIGLNYADALAFLSRCRQVRTGALPQQVLNELNSFHAAAGESSDESLHLILASLRPTTRREVIDLVKAAGVDVSPWYVKQDGSPVSAPRSNPAYCFNWAFGGNGETTVACLWHASLDTKYGKIVFEENVRELAERLKAISDADGESQDIKSRARKQARSAGALDQAFAQAWEEKKPIRVIVNEGLRRSADTLGRESSQVELRKLDTANWYVQDYDHATGRVRLERHTEGVLENSPSPAEATPEASKPKAELSAPRFVDQYTIEDAAPERQETTRYDYVRSRSVRDAALHRAQGICEFCGEKGFITRNGTVFLETHHVVPLSEGGVDHESNVAALCPNDHSEAHYGERAVGIRQQLQSKLAKLYISMAGEETEGGAIVSTILKPDSALR